MKTRDRILAEALRLFNEQGERAVTTNHIAAALGMSPGNLYYHFRNKEAIVAALFEAMAGRFEALLAQSQGERMSLPALLAFLDGLFDKLWRYRFFNRNLSHLLSRDEKLAADYAEYTTRMLQHLRLLLRALDEQGVLAIPADELDGLVDNTWLVGTFWLNYRESAYHDQALTEATVRAGISQILGLYKPYVRPEARELYAGLRRHYTGS
ncbi:MAG: TetR/AcrR family transcriptional regulator [Gammaproteobacteria bacterium]|nr:TetR/AcrR family transcriptional regulator [Gammaproteobacteria bacterium]